MLRTTQTLSAENEASLHLARDEISKKYLKLAYSVAYIKTCILIAYVHLLRNSDNYTQVLNASELEPASLNEIANLRGLNNEEIVEKKTLENLIRDTGIIYQGELSDSVLSGGKSGAKDFQSAGEFLESVEDSRDSVWLIEIVMKNYQVKKPDLTCGKSKFLRESTWKLLNENLARFGILTGVFNCERNAYFCSIKNWSRPQLLLAVVNSKSDTVEFFYYTNCKNNNYANVTKWLRQILNNRLTMEKKRQQLVHNEKFLLKVFYKTNSANKIPLHYSTMSVKYNRRANFSILTNSTTSNDFLTYCQNFASFKTPIFVINEKTCYNYGANLNELPNYAHLNLFLAFLYPDMNNIFIISFFCLNAYLLMFFAEYNTSLFRQFMRAIFYICLSNFFLFSIWLLTVNTNSTRFSAYFNQLLNSLIYLFRYFLLYNEITQKLTAHARFITFYYIHKNPAASLILYCVVLLVYYKHTKFLFKKRAQLNILPKNNESSLLPVFNETNEDSSNINNDYDHEISELIDQINGVTTIWLQSSTHADRLIAELPCVEYCKCYFMNRVDSLNETETDEDKYGEVFAACQCGKNKNLKNDLDEIELAKLSLKLKQECAICLEKYKIGSFVMLLPCAHTFHRNCVYQWFMNSVNYKLTCPICRSSFNKFKKTL